MPDLAHNLFVIDATFLVRASREAFLGVSLFETNGVDQTFEYGICRDLLRLRQAIGAERFLVTLGSETYSASDDPQRLDGVATFLRQLGVPVINEPE
ncbi:MAG: hypothetical protein ACK2UK_02850, partial [Candidatus Promineifilaceae bacterium]